MKTLYRPPSHWLAVFCLALFCEAATTACAATLTVTSSADSGAGTLRQALDSSANGDTINFSLTTPATITLTSGELLVTKSVSIAGPGATNLLVNGNAASRVFYIAPSTTVAISSLTVTNGLGLGSPGGGIVNDRASLIVSNCNLSGNSVFGVSGGGIYNVCVGFETASVKIVNSTLSGNSSFGGNGGGIYNEGTKDGKASVQVVNSTVSDNFADVNGGGIYNSSRSDGSATVEVVSSTLSGNSSGFLGGGIANVGPDTHTSARVEIVSSILSGNSANVSGGGIYNYGRSPITRVEVLNSTVSGNSALNGSGGGIYNDDFASLTVSNSIMSNNSANADGGGIFNDRASLTVSNSTLSGNSALGGSGGAIYNYRGSASVEIVTSTLSGNSAPEGDGGAILNFGSFGSATLQIANSTLSGNKAGGFGGAIDNFGVDGNASAQILNCTLTGNSAKFGGCIYNKGARPFGRARVEISSSILNASASGGNVLNDLGTVTSLGYNLSSDAAAGFLTATGDQITIDPRLGPLQDNGGPTFTHALLCGGPAIDQGRNFSASVTDQRGAGFARTFDDPAVPNAIGGDGTDIGTFEAQFHIVDSTPPTVTCPSNISELTSGPGAVGTFSVTATDICDPDIVVTCVPPAGSVFPIGATSVHCTARDANSNSASCSFTVTVLGARGVKENVLAELIGLRATVTDQDDGEMLDEAIEHLTKSLAPELWVDQTHLERKHGEKVFHEERETVKTLCDLSKRNQSNIPDAILQGFVDRIFRADRLLASVAIQDAITAGVSRKKIEQAQNHLGKGDAETGDDKCDNGIEDYRNAWKHAVRAKVSPLIHLANGRLQLGILGEPGERFTIQASSNLVNWVTLGTSTTNAEGVATFEDPDASRYRARYYRAISE